jgi:predicted homoserine dehydrogenase-like protein
VYLWKALTQRAAAGEPVRVGLVGAGKFGAMFLAQAPTTPGLAVTGIADLRPDAARGACRAVGWDGPRIDSLFVTDDAAALARRADVDVIVEATGDPRAGVAHARAAFAAGKPVVMVNVEADVLAGPVLAEEAKAAGVVYSMAYGDQPALVVELVEWARSCGFCVVAAGKGTKHHPSYHASTPDTVWEHYGLQPEAARAAGMNPKMFNSFLDGTKSALEMAAIANATGLAAPPGGLAFPPCPDNRLAEVLRPASEGGVLPGKGMVEVVSSLDADGAPVPRDLRWGVYVVVEAPTDYAAACFRQYGMPTDPSGRYAALYRPFHLIGLELNVSILAAGLMGVATGTTEAFRADVVATAKRPLKAGERLDGEGGATVWGKLQPAAASVAAGGLPIGLTEGATLTRDVAEGAMLRWDDVALDETDPLVVLRKGMRPAA